MSPDLLALFDPSPDALLNLLRERVDDPILRAIAAADYGQGLEENFRKLKEIRKTGQIPTPMSFPLQEVLELSSYREPDDPKRNLDQDGLNRRCEHTARAFACAVLLQAAAIPEQRHRFLGELTSIVQLLASALALDRYVHSATAARFAWQLSALRNESEDETIPFLELSLFWLAFSLGEPRFSESIVVRLADELIETEARIRANINPMACDTKKGRTRWLLGLSSSSCHPQSWKSIARSMLEVTMRLSSEAARTKVRLISELLLRVTQPEYPK